MSSGGINLVAVLAAAVAGFLFGGIWYGAFSRQALARSAKTDKPRPRLSRFRVDTVPLIVTFVAMLIMAYVLAGAMGTLEAGELTVRSGIVSALFAWAGFVMTSLVVGHMVEGVSGLATLVDAGHWLGVLVIQGAVIGWLGA